MSTDNQKMQPWQVFHAARKQLGASTVARIFGREKRSAYNWAQDPSYTQHRCKSPLELMHTLFQRMDEIGLSYVARSAIAYLQTSIEPDELSPIQEPLPTITEEILADYTAVAVMQRAIESCADIDIVDDLKQDAIDEIERTYAKYLQDCR